MRCEVDGCGRPFAPNQIVFLVKNDDGKPVNCCSEDCAKTVEDQLKQADMFGQREKRRYIVDEAVNAGCMVSQVSAVEGNDGLKKIMKIKLPYSSSIDRLLQFTGASVKIAIMQERLDEVVEDADPVFQFEEPDPMTVEGALFRALRHKEDAEKRWADRIEGGMTDPDIRLAIAYEFGKKDALPAVPDTCKPCAFEGDKAPKFWYGDNPVNQKPTLTGKPLIKMARDVMKIQTPAQFERAAKKAEKEKEKEAA